MSQVEIYNPSRQTISTFVLDATTGKQVSKPIAPRSSITVEDDTKLTAVMQQQLKNGVFKKKVS